jgi:hypothetical protein
VLAVVDRSRRDRYAPRPLCQNLGAQLRTVTCPGAPRNGLVTSATSGFDLSARESMHASSQACSRLALHSNFESRATLEVRARTSRSFDSSSTARGAEAELRHGLECGVLERPRLTRNAKARSSSPTPVPCCGDGEQATLRAARDASSPHPTLIPTPRLRSIGPLSPSTSRTREAAAHGKRSSGARARSRARRRLSRSLSSCPWKV